MHASGFQAEGWLQDALHETILLEEDGWLDPVASAEALRSSDGWNSTVTVCTCNRYSGQTTENPDGHMNMNWFKTRAE